MKIEDLDRFDAFIWLADNGIYSSDEIKEISVEHLEPILEGKSAFRAKVKILKEFGYYEYKTFSKNYKKLLELIVVLETNKERA